MSQGLIFMNCNIEHRKYSMPLNELDWNYNQNVSAFLWIWRTAATNNMKNLAKTDSKKLQNSCLTYLSKGQLKSSNSIIFNCAYKEEMSQKILDSFI